MTPSELKRHVEGSGRSPHYFTRETMRFFGDTMRNYGVRPAVIDGRPAFELYRRRPVMHGLSSSAYFCAESFARLFPSRDTQEEVE